MANIPAPQQLGDWARKAKSALARFRAPLFAAALILFGWGVYWSIGQLDLRWSNINLPALFALILILAPLSIIYGAVNFMVMARAASLDVPFTSAFKTSAISQFAAILPLPGGALVRGGAMMARGSTMRGAASHVTINALLWIACAAIAAGISLIAISNSLHPASIAIAAGGAIAAASCMAWLVKVSSLPVALSVFALRIIGVALSALRLTCAFYTIGVAINYWQAFPFAFASILGTASSIAPAGLGISEALAAAIAILSGITSAAAFLAVGLNRIIGIAVSGILTGIISLIASDQMPSGEKTEEL